MLIKIRLLKFLKGDLVMIYKIGMLCKHFKGKTLLEKNIYRIENIGIDGKDIDESVIKYTGDNELCNAKNLVIYSNIFQDYKMFAREYEDISSELEIDKQIEFNQVLRVQPLTLEEIDIVNGSDFIIKKRN